MSNRIRTIKPEWLEDELLALASDGARVLSVALMLLADDYGNGRANLTLLTGRAFPGKLPEQVAPLVDELVAIRYIQLYEVDGQRYFHIRNWSKHQKIDRPSKPRVPEFPLEASVKKQPESTANESTREDEGSTREGLASVSDNNSSDGESTRASRGSRSRSRSIPGPDPDPANEFPDSDSEKPLHPDFELHPLAVKELAEWSGQPEVVIQAAVREFVGYWVVGAGANKPRSHWQRRCRDDIRRKHESGKLAEIAKRLGVNAKEQVLVWQT